MFSGVREVDKGGGEVVFQERRQLTCCRIDSPVQEKDAI